MTQSQSPILMSGAMVRAKGQPSERLLDLLRALEFHGGSWPRGELRDLTPGIFLPLVREGLSLGLIRTNHEMWELTDSGALAIPHPVNIETRKDAQR